MKGKPSESNECILLVTLNNDRNLELGGKLLTDYTLCQGGGNNKK